MQALVCYNALASTNGGTTRQDALPAYGRAPSNAIRSPSSPIFDRTDTEEP